MKLENDPIIRKIVENKTQMSSSQKVLLIRKANELMNNSKVEEAKKIYLATKNSGGISRVGDYYYEKQNFIEAARMYFLSKDERKIEFIAKEFANTLKKWIK